MPTEYAAILKGKRKETLDENEKDSNHLYNAERAYIEVANMFDFETIECIRNSHTDISRKKDIKTPSEINDEVYNIVKRKLTLR